MATILIDPTDVGTLGPFHLLDAGPGEQTELSQSLRAVRVPAERWDAAARDPAVGFEDLGYWTEAVAALGIHPERAVPVVFDDGRLTEAARVWFILQYFGIEARVLNGRLADLPEGLVPADLPRPSVAALKPGSGRVALVGRDALRDALGRVRVLDVRTTAEFAGDDLRRNGRGGHLPGAVSLPHAELLDDGGRVASAERLKRAIDGAALPDGPVVTHCDAGGRAALAALALVEAGRTDVSTYYLSFSDWSADATCPVLRD